MTDQEKPLEYGPLLPPGPEDWPEGRLAVILAELHASVPDEAWKDVPDTSKLDIDGPEEPQQ